MNQKVFLFAGLLSLSMFSVAQRNVKEQRVFEISGTGISTAQAIKGFADNMRISYPYHRIERMSFDSTVNRIIYNIYPGNIGRIKVKIPCVWNEQTAIEVFNVIDSLARTDTYNNKIIANDIAHWLAWLGERNGDWQKEIALKAAMLDLDYSARFTYSPAITNLPKTIYTPEIIERVAGMFRNPYISHEEAEIIVKGQSPWYTSLDTTGYAGLQEKYNTRPALNDMDAVTYKETSRLDRIYLELKHIQSKGQTIQQYTDSLNRRWYERELNGLDGKLWHGCSNIISYAGWKRIYSLAPLIDSFATPEMCSKMNRSRQYIDKTLAGLGYKDYPQRQENLYLYRMDSCIVYLKDHPKLDADSVYLTMRTLKDCYETMEYIGVSDIFYKFAPVLTITNKMKSSRAFNFQSDNYISIGSFFLFDLFMENIENIPAPDDTFAEWDENNTPTQMYRWMMDNKDNYKLRNPPD